jgi:hypothetical protein
VTSQRAFKRKPASRSFAESLTPSDYIPLDLAGLCNASTAVLDREWEKHAMRPASLEADFAAPTPRLPPIGHVTLRGLPFLIGTTEPLPDPAARACFLAFGEGGYREPITVRVGTHARWILFAHLLLETDIPDGGSIGDVVAEYAFSLASGASRVVPIRELFEIAIRPRFMGGSIGSLPSLWAASPFVAQPDRYDTFFDRDGGPWHLSGTRLKESMKAPTRGYHLWAWRNDSQEVVTAITIRPRGRPFLVAGITIGYEDEHPLLAQAATVRIVGNPRAVHSFRLELDRGSAGSAVALASRSSEAFLDETVRGRGDSFNQAGSPAYARLIGIPSATLSLLDNETAAGSVRWGDVDAADGPVSLAGGLSIERIDRETTWAHVTVVDEATGAPVPCRVHFRSEAGVPYQPHGHPQHLAANLPTWHIDVGGDLRLGATTYAYIDGRCQGWLPVGPTLVEVTRGPEYVPLREVVEIKPGQRELRLTLRRWTDMRASNWYSGDTHVHFLSTSGAHLEGSGEDLSVVNLLQAQWASLFTNAEDWTGRPSVSPDWGTIVYVSQENRQHLLGHLGLLGLTEPVMPWSSDGPAEAEFGSPLDVTLADWADECRRQGGTVIGVHFGYPYGELPALIATGRVDALEMIQQQRFSHDAYYGYLNAGYRLPLVGGTDKMTGETPVGQYRTFVHLRAAEEFDYASWCRNLRAGRTFVSAGPMIGIAVDGREPGDTIRVGGDGGTVEVYAWAASSEPIHTLQLVQAGRVVAEVAATAGSRRLELREPIRITGDTWIAARAGGPDYFGGRRTLSSFSVGIFAHTSPVYVACGREWQMRDDEVRTRMRSMILGCLEYIHHGTSTGGSQGHRPHGASDHVTHLSRPFEEALVQLDATRKEPSS